jgi:predicted transcriptional regulator
MATGDAVVTIALEAAVGDAAEALAVSRAGDLMVVDAAERLLGVLAEGDVLRNALPSFDEILDAGGTLDDAYAIFVRKARVLASKPIAPLVIREPIVLRPGDHIAQAATILVERQIRQIPVVDGDRLVGTLSRVNVSRWLAGWARP